MAKEKRNPVSLKELQTRKQMLEDQLRSAQEDKTALGRRVDDIYRRLKSVQQQLAAMKRAETHVTEHAIIRYLEHVLGMDMQQIRDEILSDGVRVAIKASGGNCKVPISQNRGKAVIKNNTVVTVVPIK